MSVRNIRDYHYCRYCYYYYYFYNHFVSARRKNEGISQIFAIRNRKSVYSAGITRARIPSDFSENYLTESTRDSSTRYGGIAAVR